MASANPDLRFLYCMFANYFGSHLATMATC